MIIHDDLLADMQVDYRVEVDLVQNLYIFEHLKMHKSLPLVACKETDPRLLIIESVGAVNRGALYLHL